MSRKRPTDRKVQLSKAMSYLLRHGAEKEGFKLKDGYLYGHEILSLSSISAKGFSESDIMEVVETNEKQRFHMKRDNVGKIMVRANQGHSMSSIDEGSLGLTPFMETEATVIHGTTLAAWESIKHEGLSKMTRQHIHFAPGLLGDAGVISGMRKNCEVHIYINMSQALEDGLKFYLSKNNVILCSGNDNGLIMPKYFEAVWKAKPREQLL